MMWEVHRLGLTPRHVLLVLVACAWCWLGRPAGAQECDCYSYCGRAPGCEYCDGQGGISYEPLWDTEIRNPTCGGTLSRTGSKYRQGTCALCSTEQVVAAMEAARNDSNVHANALKSLLAGRGDGWVRTRAVCRISG